MTPFAHIPAWSGAPVRDCDGRDAGHVVEVRFDAAHAPEALVIADGSRHALVPAQGAVSFAGYVKLPYASAAIWPAAPAPPATRVQSRPAALAA